VEAESAYRPDWREGAAYAPLLDADRSLFAWEWLRRDARYRLAAEQALCASASIAAQPEQFGLVAFEPPHASVPYARPVWRSDVHPFVLTAEPVHSDRRIDAFEPASFGDLARIIAADGAEHLLLSDGMRVIRLDGPPRTFSAERNVLRYLIEGLASAEAPVLTLRRFLLLCRTGRFSPLLHRREARARRWIMMLRASDALAEGADQRQIAKVLLSRSVVEPRWRSRESSVRSQAQRLVRAARQFAAGGHRRLLR
jgi:hypothetical protein